MVPVIAPSHLEARAALRSLITESCRRDLSKVFVAWLLQESEQRAESASIAAQAAKREGADQDFQTIATLGIAVDAGLLSEPQVAALKRGLSRLAGRSPTINEVPMAFCADAVGILGVALGTRSIKDPVVTGQVVGWVAKFLKTSYERGGADDWQRCLFAVADRQLGGTLGLSVPESASTADVRTALVAKGLIEVGDGKKAREDEAQTLALAVQETPKDFAYDRAALRLAAVEWIIRQARPPSGPIFIQETAKGSMDRPSQTDPIWTITSSQKGPIPVTRLNGEVVWINTADPDEPDDAAYTPEDELRVAEVTLNGRSELRSEIETVFGGPAWPPASAIVEPFRRYATKVFDVNAAAYRRVASTQARASHEVLNAMVRNLLSDVFGSEWESNPGEKVTRTDWQFGIEGWKGREIVVIAGNDADKNCLYHQLVGDAITYRYRFHAIPPAPIPGEPPGINLSNLEWWQYIGLNERHNLAMAIKPYLEDRIAHWQFVYKPGVPTDASGGGESVLPMPDGPSAPSVQKDLPQVNVAPMPRKKRGRPIQIPEERKQRALRVRGGKARAQVLYGTKYPTPQQVKNVSSILRHYRGKQNQG